MAFLPKERTEPQENVVSFAGFVVVVAVVVVAVAVVAVVVAVEVVAVAFVVGEATAPFVVGGVVPSADEPNKAACLAALILFRFLMGRCYWLLVLEEDLQVLKGE